MAANWEYVIFDRWENNTAQIKSKVINISIGTWYALCVYYNGILIKDYIFEGLNWDRWLSFSIPASDINNGNVTISVELYRNSCEGIYQDSVALYIPQNDFVCEEDTQRCIEPYTLQQCQNNEWVSIEENSESCGYVPPVCTEGTHEVLEYCTDGITEKRWRDCVNNQWIENSQECPCECSDWLNAECINETQRRQVRTCTPAGCEIEEQIIYDGSCATPCTCTPWLNAECINETQRRIVRTCTPTGCDIEELVIEDSSCAAKPFPIVPVIIAGGGLAAAYFILKKKQKLFNQKKQIDR